MDNSETNALNEERGDSQIRNEFSAVQEETADDEELTQERRIEEKVAVTYCR